MTGRDGHVRAQASIIQQNMEPYTLHFLFMPRARQEHPENEQATQVPGYFVSDMQHHTTMNPRETHDSITANCYPVIRCATFLLK